MHDVVFEMEEELGEHMIDNHGERTEGVLGDI
jgi:hypothetical protein